MLYLHCNESDKGKPREIVGRKATGPKKKRRHG